VEAYLLRIRQKLGWTAPRCAVRWRSICGVKWARLAAGEDLSKR